MWFVLQIVWNTGWLLAALSFKSITKWNGHMNWRHHAQHQGTYCDDNHTRGKNTHNTRGWRRTLRLCGPLDAQIANTAPVVAGRFAGWPGRARAGARVDHYDRLQHAQARVCASREPRASMFRVGLWSNREYTVSPAE